MGPSFIIITANELTKAINSLHIQSAVIHKRKSHPRMRSDSAFKHMGQRWLAVVLIIDVSKFRHIDQMGCNTNVMSMTCPDTSSTFMMEAVQPGP